MGRLLRFGRNMVGMQIVGYMNNNLDSVVVGRVFGASTLGVYNRAFQLLMVPLAQTRAPMTTVALPVLSRLDEEPDKYSAFVSRGQVALGYTVVPGLAIVAAAAAAEPVVALFLGDQWASVTPPLRFFAFAGVVNQGRHQRPTHVRRRRLVLLECQPASSGRTERGDLNAVWDDLKVDDEASVRTGVSGSGAAPSAAGESGRAGAVRRLAGWPSRGFPHSMAYPAAVRSQDWSAALVSVHCTACAPADLLALSTPSTLALFALIRT